VTNGGLKLDYASVIVELLQGLVVYISARLWLSAHKTLVYSIHVSLGSVATRLMRGGIFNDIFIANCLQSALVKELLQEI